MNLFESLFYILLFIAAIYIIFNISWTIRQAPEMEECEICGRLTEVKNLDIDGVCQFCRKKIQNEVEAVQGFDCKSDAL